MKQNNNESKGEQGNDNNRVNEHSKWNECSGV